MPNPEVAVPYCMLSSVAINGTLGFAFLLAILFCMGDIEAALDTDTGYPIIEILQYVTGSTAASTAMTCTIILMAVLATVALFPSSSRMLWSLARDKGKSLLSSRPDAIEITYTHPL
jgi:amino acid transporter